MHAAAIAWYDELLLSPDGLTTDDLSPDGLTNDSLSPHALCTNGISENARRIKKLRNK